MDTQELKNYVAKAKEIESLIYTQEKLKPLYLNEIDKSVVSKLPNIREPNFPQKPREPEMLEIQSGLNICGIVMCILSVFSLIFFLYFLIVWNDASIFMLLFSIVSGLLGWLLIKTFLEQKSYHAINYKRTEDYNRQLQLYEEECDKEAKRYEIIKKQYEQKLAEYEFAKEKSIEHKNKISASFDETTSTLKNSLEKLYDKNIIFPKYRNFVAITMISEYLESGRCSELEGPNGAYNLYESELRQNIIINQLSAIIDNLEQIRNNQFILYQEISNSNMVISNMLSNIHDEMVISNYFAEITAKAAIAPRVGIVF